MIRTGRAPSSSTHVLSLFALANLLSYASRNVPFAVYDDLRAAYFVDDGQLGWLGTAFILPHALATLPVGWFGDRVDRRRLVALGLVIASVGSVLGAVAPTFELVLASRFLVGFGLAAIVPVANAIIGDSFGGAKKAFALAIFNLGLFLGGVAGFGVGAALGFPLGWIVIAAPAVVVAGALLAIELPPGPPPSESLSRSTTKLRRDAVIILRIPTVRRLMAATTVMAFAAGGMQAWLLDFLQNEKHMSKGAATTLLGICMVGGLAGVVAGGRVADRLSRGRVWGRPGAIALGMALTVPCAAGCVFAPDGPLLYAASMGTMFFISWYHGPMAASVDDVAPGPLAATAQAVVIAFMHLVGTAPSSRVIGELYEQWGRREAMMVATAAVAVAALLTARAFSTFGSDAARAEL
ncbi:MAG TPA: MFS transporter [Kofleriaceae bacterium]|nr:MFS transporter [Kofleriaceae bacterium]